MDDKLKIAKDGGYRSRKLWFAILTQVLVVLAAKFVPIPALDVAIMGLVSVCGLYLAGNTVVKLKAGTIEQTQAKKPAPREQPND